MFKNLKYVYYPDHDERFAHILKEERHEYPDEIVDMDLGETILKRRHTRAELRELDESYTPPQLHGQYAMALLSNFSGFIFCKDVPLSKAFQAAKETREWNERMHQRMNQLYPIRK